MLSTFVGKRAPSDHRLLFPLFEMEKRMKFSKKHKKRERKKKKIKNYEDINNAERHISES